MVTSTPNLSHENIALDESGLSVVEQPPSPPLLLTDSSTNETHNECTPRSIFQHAKSEASNIHFDGVKKISDDKKRKGIGKEGENNDSGNSILILIEAMECDCEDENPIDIDERNKRKEASKKNIVDKEEGCVKVATESNARTFLSNERSAVNSGQNKGTESKNRHVSLAQITEKRSGESNGHSSRKKGVRRDSAVEKKTKKMKHSNNSETNLHLLITRSSSAACHAQMSDASSTADLQDMEHKIVNTLRDNLSVIEELYRECFYESAKQEELITMLRRSYLDMRLMERQKSEQIGRLQHVVHSQRCSLERCQDIALEVENLKSEITNFLNSSQNNDSGVWGEDDVCDISEELRGIADQLRRLRDMLNTDCTCGLEDENMKLKKINETMETQLGELRERVNNLEEALKKKDNMEQQYQEQIQEKERELHDMRCQLVALEEGSRERDNTCDALNCKLKQMEVLLKDKSSELLSAQQQCEAQETTIKELREQLSRADLMARENGQVREEVSCLSSQVSQWREQLSSTRRRLRALEAELQRAREQCRHLAVHYREKAQLAEELQSQLEEAQSRGTELCGEARRAVCGVRHWLRKQRQKNREQEEKIKQQEIIIQTLKQGASSPTEHVTTNDNEPCCSKHLTRVEARRSDPSFVSASETGCSKCASRKVVVRTSESEIASSPTPPTPPRRLLRKKAFCGDIRCQWPVTRESSAQRPSRSDASVNTRLSDEQLSLYTATPTREMSPTDELLERVERAHEALADAHKRWSRGAGARAVDR